MNLLVVILLGIVFLIWVSMCVFCDLIIWFFKLIDCGLFLKNFLGFRVLWSIRIVMYLYRMVILKVFNDFIILWFLGVVRNCWGLYECSLVFIWLWESWWNIVFFVIWCIFLLFYNESVCWECCYDKKLVYVRIIVIRL